MDNIKPTQDNYKAIEEQDNSTSLTKHKYIDIETNTELLEPLYKKICVRTVSNNINTLDVEKIFSASNIKLVNQLIQTLDNSSENILNKIQAFLQLHKLANLEYKNLFIEKWQEGYYKFIIVGHFELVSVLDLTQENISIEELSNKISELLLLSKNELKDINKTEIEQKIIILIMLIEKRIIDRDILYYPNKYKISAADFTSSLPSWEYTDIESEDEYMPNEDDIPIYSNPASRKQKDIKLTLSRPEIGTLDGKFSNYIFTRAKNFTEMQLQINCEMDGKFHKKLCVNINKFKALDMEMFNTLFLHNDLLFVLLHENYKLAFNYLLNSEYFVHNLNNNIYANGGKPSFLLPDKATKHGKHLLSQASCKGTEYISQLLNNGAELSSDIIIETICNHKLISFPITTADEIIFNSILFMLQHAEENTLNHVRHYISKNKISYIFGIKNKIPSLLDYILEYYPLEKKEEVITLIFQKIINFSLYSHKDIIAILVKIYDYKELRLFITEKISNEFIFSWLSNLNNTIIRSNTLFTDKIIYLLIKVLHAKLDSPKSQLAKYLCNNHYNNILIQLVFLGVSSTDKSISSSAKKLYEKYLSLDNIKTLLQNDSFNILFGDLEGNPAWCEKEYKQAHNYILISKNDTVILLSHEILAQFLDTKDKHSFIDWKQFFLFDTKGNNQTIYHCNLNKIFTKHFKIFAENFSNYSHKGLVFVNFIRELSLGKYEKILINGLNTYKQSQSLTSHSAPIGNKDYELYKKLIKHINIINDSHKSVGITAANLTIIKKIFELENKTDNEVAKYLVCIASLFIKFSSQSVFGTSFSSPYSLRFYAYSLLKQAYKLDNKAFFLEDNTKDGEERYKDWTDRLMGKKFSCTDVLFAIIQEYIKKNYNAEIKSIIPVDWL